jgi:hypothetical protein
MLRRILVGGGGYAPVLTDLGLIRGWIVAENFQVQMQRKSLLGQETTL